jgi:hypothetical protein
MAADVFNYLFDHPDWLQYLYAVTHNEFMQLWEEADGSLQHATAFGFVSHNDQWGADATAHHAGRTFGREQGYVIAKAEQIAQIASLSKDFGIPIPDLVAFELYHNFVESAVDILLAQHERTLGAKMASAALSRTPLLPLLLVQTYAPGFVNTFALPYREAVRVILAAEFGFRRTTVLYGQALMQDETTAVQLLAEQMADLAEGFVAAYAPEVALPERSEVVKIIKSYLILAMDLCAGDYVQEIEATVAFVAEGLTAAGITERGRQ